MSTFMALSVGAAKSDVGAGDVRSATYEQLEAIECNLSAFPNVEFFRVEV